MIKNIRHIGIVVEDLESSLWFYRDLLGLKVVKRMEESGEYLETVLGLQGASVTTVKMATSDDQQVELVQYDSKRAERGTRRIHDVGIGHVAFTVEDLDREHKRLEGNGVSFISSPQRSSDGYAKVAFCIAPEGTFVELVEVLG